MSDIEIGSEWVQKKKTPKEFEVVVLSGDSLMVKENGEGFSIPWYTSDFLEHHEPKAKAEMINQPKHYNDESGIPCCDVTDFMMFNGGNCFKYLYRCGSKFDDIEDLKKAAWYAERAKQKSEFYSDGDWAYLIREIARYRSNDAIHTAMIALRWCRWSDVVVAVNAEIARLESE